MLQFLLDMYQKRLFQTFVNLEQAQAMLHISIVLDSLTIKIYFNRLSTVISNMNWLKKLSKLNLLLFLIIRL